MTRVLITVEPRMYREVLIIALRGRPPLVESVLAEPAALDHAAGRFEPHLIVCSHVTQKVRDGTASWIEVQVKDGLEAVTCVDGRRSKIRDLRLEGVMNSILGMVVWNMQARRRYLSGIPDEGWGFGAPYVAPVGATEHGVRLEVVEHPEAERGFVCCASGRWSSAIPHMYHACGGWWRLRSLVLFSIGPSP